MILFFYVHNAKMNEWIYFYYDLKKITLIWKIILKFIYYQHGTLKIWIAILFLACDCKENLFKKKILHIIMPFHKWKKEVKISW